MYAEKNINFFNLNFWQLQQLHAPSLPLMPPVAMAPPRQLAITYVPSGIVPPLPPKVPSTSTYKKDFSQAGFYQGGAMPLSRRYNPNLNPFAPGHGTPGYWGKLFIFFCFSGFKLKINIQFFVCQLDARLLLGASKLVFKQTVASVV